MVKIPFAAHLGHTAPLIETFYQQISNAFQVLSRKRTKRFSSYIPDDFRGGVCLKEYPIKSSSMICSRVYLIWQCQSSWPPSKEASPLKSGRRMCQQPPMLERGLTMFLLTLGHTKKLYSFPLKKYIHSILECEKHQEHIVETSIGGNQWNSTKLHTYKLKCFNIIFHETY